MKFSNALLGLTALTRGINAAAAPAPDAVALDARTPEPELETRLAPSTTNEELWKRKGGGGGGGRGGGAGGGGSSGGSRGGSSGGSSGGGRGLGSSTSNTGGRTSTGSGPPPRYGGAYGGGSTLPYQAGKQSRSGIVPGLLAGAALGGVAFLGIAFLYGAYSYPYTHPYSYHNVTTNKNETKPVVCLCDPYSTCGCDENSNQTYVDSILGNGSYQALNHSLVAVAENQTTKQSTIYINGVLPNGTTASGGTEDPNAANSMIALARAAGWWPAATMAFAIAFLI
ncbi:hypothetical protein F5Y14DRAFT_118167 [Nemania sp. NC0429]|nr:hypothetical protein F5Y14DRAFT_118167 [Nemania sp. NC0429]